MEDWLKFTNTLNNFYNYSVSLKENENYFKQLDYKGIIAARCMIIDVLLEKKYSAHEAIESIFNVCMKILIPESHPFRLEHCLYENVLQSYIFVALLNFIHDTKRIPASSYRTYVALNSDNEEIIAERHQYKYRTYFSNLLNVEADAMRQRDYRLYKKRLFVKNNNPKSSIRKDMEHERLLYYKINKFNKTEQNTFKRFHCLYNEINLIINGKYTKSIDEGVKSFQSKLSKLKYENIVKLQQSFIKHINLDKEYYCFNLYRLEKELCVYNLSFEIAQLLSCNNEFMEHDFLLKFHLLNGIEFPNVYNYFFSFHNIDKIMQYSISYRLYKEQIVLIGDIILDECIEKGLFGDNWHKSILEILNEKTEYVLYSPDNIQFNTSPDAQKAFEKILSDQALRAIRPYQNQNNYN